MKNRAIIILADVFLILSGMLLVLHPLFNTPALSFVAPLIFLIAVIAQMLSTRCPHCKRIGAAPNPFGRDYGYCPNCGKKIEYKN